MKILSEHEYALIRVILSEAGITEHLHEVKKVVKRCKICKLDMRPFSMLDILKKENVQFAYLLEARKKSRYLEKKNKDLQRRINNFKGAGHL